jgi:hypothetical protein
MTIVNNRVLRVTPRTNAIEGPFLPFPVHLTGCVDTECIWRYTIRLMHCF